MSLIACAACAKTLKVDNTLAGGRLLCPRCGAAVELPTPSNLLSQLISQPLSQPLSESLSEPSLEMTPREMAEGVSELIPTRVVPVSPSVAKMQEAQDEPQDSFNDILSPPIELDEIGRLGGFRIMNVVGAGGMGVVFQAEDSKLKRTVAVKAMLPSAERDKSAGKRFLREAEAMAKVEHRHVARIYQVDEERGVPFLAMEFLKGEPLDARLKREGALPVAEVARIGREIAEGLAAAHQLGLVHRDIKPANIWLERPDQNVKILDFGLARPKEEGGQLTEKGMVVGTPAFMAPEQSRGGNVDGRADLFSLGVLLYLMATGKLPFDAPDPVAMMVAVAADKPKAPREHRPELPVELERLILKLLAKKPKDRPQSANDVTQSLAAVARLPARPATPRRWGAALVAAVVLTCTAVGIWQAFFRGAPADVTLVAKAPPVEQNPPVKLIANIPDPAIVKKTSDPLTDPLIDLLTSTDYEWTPPESLGAAINGSRRVLNPTLSADERIIVYSRDGKFWMSRRPDRSVPFPSGERLPDSINDRTSEASSLSGDGLLLAFTSYRDGAKGTSEAVYVASRASVDEPFGVPVRLPPGINATGMERVPVFSNDGLSLLLTTYNLPGATGSGDVTVFTRKSRNDMFDNPVVLPEPVNTGAFDVANWMSPGGGVVFTIAMGKLGHELRMCARRPSDGRFLAAYPPLPPSCQSVQIGHPWLSPDGRRMYFHTKDLPGKNADLHLWMTKLEPRKGLPARHVNSVGMTFALVPKGRSWLGGREGNEGTEAIDFKDDFYLGVFEVTQGEWAKVMGGTNPSRFSRTGERKADVADIVDGALARFPVDSLSANEARQFLDKLNQLTKESGWTYRLPTANEWEYACRGGPIKKSDSAFDFYVGRPTVDLLPERANVKSRDLKRTRIVGASPPNALGLFDMHGNVFELCDETITNERKEQVAKLVGGSYHDPTELCRASHRGWVGSDAHYDGSGFRVVRVRTKN